MQALLLRIKEFGRRHVFKLIALIWVILSIKLLYKNDKIGHFDTAVKENKEVNVMDLAVTNSYKTEKTITGFYTEVNPVFSLILLSCSTASCVLYNRTEHSRGFFIR